MGWAGRIGSQVRGPDHGVVNELEEWKGKDGSASLNTHKAVPCPGRVESQQGCSSAPHKQRCGALIGRTGCECLPGIGLLLRGGVELESQREGVDRGASAGLLLCLWEKRTASDRGRALRTFAAAQQRELIRLQWEGREELQNGGWCSSGSYFSASWCCQSSRQWGQGEAGTRGRLAGTAGGSRVHSGRPLKAMRCGSLSAALHLRPEKRKQGSQLPLRISCPRRACLQPWWLPCGSSGHAGALRLPLAACPVAPVCGCGGTGRGTGLAESSSAAQQGSRHRRRGRAAGGLHQGQPGNALSACCSHTNCT